MHLLFALAWYLFRWHAQYGKMNLVCTPHSAHTHTQIETKRKINYMEMCFHDHSMMIFDMCMCGARLYTSTLYNWMHENENRMLKRQKKFDFVVMLPINCHSKQI